MTDEPENGGMWAGTGWKRTQRQAGLIGFTIAAIVDTALPLTVPVAVYSILAGLLGLDVLIEALDRIRGRRG